MPLKLPPARRPQSRNNDSRTPKTPVEVLEAFEKKRQTKELLHQQSMGDQLLSVRPTTPGYSFGFRATQEKTGDRITWDQLDNVWTTKSSPGPGTYSPTHILVERRAPVLARESSATPVLAFWGTEPRFIDSGAEQPFLSEAEGKAHAAWAAAEAGLPRPASVAETIRPVWATGGDPRRPSSQLGDDDFFPAVVEDAAGVDEVARAGSSSGPLQYRSTSSNGARRPTRKPGNGRLPGRPQSSFGTSGLGCRFHGGTKFSRTAPCETVSRLRNFRDLRDDIDLYQLARKELASQRSPVSMSGRSPRMPSAADG